MESRYFIVYLIMPAIKIITPILGDRYYHLFNRGNNSQQVFFTEENYNYFLRQFYHFMNLYVDVLAYSLMPNHFHFLIKTKDSISSVEKSGISSIERDGIPEIGKIISNQFRSLFITYAMAINKQENRTGSLFSKNFKRLEIEDENYLRYLAFYIHYNPQKHRWIDDFRNYRYSSWKAYQSEKTSALNRKLLLEIFGGMDEFLNYHSYYHEEMESNLLE